MLPDRAQVVIIGSGIAGASVAFHLAELGWREVAVLEQGELTSGTTSHAPGLVGQLRSSVSLTKMLMDSVALYRTLSVDGVPGYISEGSLRLASSPARMAQLREQARFAASVGLEAHLVGADEAARRFPLIDRAGVEGALFLPTDGSATATVLTEALIRKARSQGVTFHPQTRVESIDVASGCVRGVQTSKGDIETGTLVLAAGIWSPIVGRLAGVSLPLTPMQHQYAISEPLSDLAGRTLPNLRDPDKLVYLRQREQSLVIGGYERNPRPFDAEAIPERRDPTVMTFDAAHFEPLCRAAAERVPALARASWSRQVNGLESFTPDGEFLLGPAPEVRGIWAACGFCAHGVSSSGGVGKAIARWIVTGDAGFDLSAMSLARFGGPAPDRAAIARGACEVYRTYYDIAGS